MTTFYFNVANSLILYEVEYNHLLRTDLNGNEKSVYPNSSLITDTFCIAGEWIFFKGNFGEQFHINKMKLDGTSVTVLETNDMLTGPGPGEY
jgi:hypothetical protein